jgi:hypothetical protein
MDPNAIVASLLEGEDPVEKQLADKLNASGTACSYEHPGYVAINTKIGELAVGTVDGYWGFNFHENGDDLVNTNLDVEDPEFWKQMPDPGAVSVDVVAAEVKKLVDWANSQPT